MNKQKVKVFLLVFLFWLWIVWFLFLSLSKDKKELLNNNIQENEKNVSKLDDLYYESEKIYWSIYTESWSLELDKKINEFIKNNHFVWASILESLIWNYNKSESLRNKVCINNNSEVCYKRDINISYDKLEWFKLESNNKWLYNNNIYRFKFSKKWYLDVFEKVYLTKYSDKHIKAEWKTLKSKYTESIDNSKSFEYKTKNFSFYIKPNTFTYNWKPVEWKIDVYFFDIGSSDWNLNVFNLDSFDERYNYIWSAMITLGMPLVKAYKWDNELDISIPISWTWKIQDTYRAPWIDLKNVPKNIFLGIDELKKYNIPPWWHYDKNKWVWFSSYMKILDEEWNYEFNLK